MKSIVSMKFTASSDSSDKLATEFSSHALSRKVSFSYVENVVSLISLEAIDDKLFHRY